MVDKFLKNSTVFKYFEKNFKIFENNFKNIENNINQNNSKLEERIEMLTQENKKLFNQCIELQNQVKVISEENKSISNRMLSEIKNVNVELLPYNIPTDKQKILVMGFFGAPNTGDELMLQSIIDKLNLNNLEVSVMIADNQDFVLDSNKNLNYIHYPRTHTDLNILTNYFDKIIFAGGALIDDTQFGNKQTQYTCLYNLLISFGESIIKKGKKLYLIGLSTANKFTNNDYLEKLNFIAKNAEYFSLRDTNSIQTLKKYNIDTNKIKVIDDLVFSMPNNINCDEIHDDEFSIGIVFVNYVDLKVLLKMISDVENFLKNSISCKKKIKLIPFYDFCHADINKYNEIVNNYCGDIKIEIVEYESDYIKISNILRSCNMLIGMRYHLSLMGLKLGIPTLHIVYDVHSHYINKMNYLLKMFDAEEYKVSLKDYIENESDIIFKKLKELYKNRESISNNTKEISEKIRSKSQNECNEIIKLIENT